MAVRIFLTLVIFVGIFPAPTYAYDVNFTKSEVEWMRGRPIIRYAIDPRWEPIEFLDGESAAGLSVAYLNKISDITGIRFEYIKTSSWSESVDFLVNGKVDLLPGVPDFDVPLSLKRQAKLSDPYFVGTTIAVTKASSRATSDLSDLSSNEKIAIRGGGAYESWVRKQYPNVQIIQFDSADGALNAVLNGLATITIGPEPILHPMIRQRYSKSLFVAGAIRNLPLALRMATNSACPELRSIVQKALASLSAEEADIIQEKWIESADFGKPSMLALFRYYGAKIAATALAFASMVIALFQIWRAKRAILEIATQRAAFLSIMAHEIRGPLNSVIASIELAGTQKNEAEMRRCIEVAIRSGEWLTSLLSNVLDYSKMDNSKVTLNKSVTTVVEILSPVLLSAKVEAKKIGIAFESSISRSIESPIVMDIDKTRQIITNIISNALKFTDQGAVLLFVSVEKHSRSENMVFCIVDTGRGIPNREIKKIINPFYQAQNRIAGRAGVGLGLAICHKIVEAMRGELEIVSSEGKGTVVTVKIPIERGCAREQSNKCVDLIIERPYQNLNILVVEDVDINRDIIKAQLRYLGFAAVGVGSGLEAINKVSTDRFDAVLLDCNLPDMSGYDLARYIRNLNAVSAPRVSIIAISANTGPVHENRCLESGIDAVVAKPINLHGLWDVLRSCVLHGEHGGANHKRSGDTLGCDIASALMAEITGVVRSAISDDVAGVEFHRHRLKGIALTFDLPKIVDVIQEDSNSKFDCRATCKRMIYLIRILDIEVFPGKGVSSS
ncbi:ATP-binding protein [Burkholderia ambifaria]|uniref:histidine kinase n=1 Tax=Burkholderia ambifaria MEX-5 TaxID=396597 RepID=B1T389_9BURK|nr:transporter substrate-binding domain-containing protein [Burkholderia ambifaria]EDT41987.1 integral membrane sensor hybrid histidine kinase [Burkholderia ambifaria MEX-5]